MNKTLLFLSVLLFSNLSMGQSWITKTLPIDAQEVSFSDIQKGFPGSKYIMKDSMSTSTCVFEINYSDNEFQFSLVTKTKDKINYPKNLKFSTDLGPDESVFIKSSVDKFKSGNFKNNRLVFYLVPKNSKAVKAIASYSLNKDFTSIKDVFIQNHNTDGSVKSKPCFNPNYQASN